jgi:hypothetical protein
MTDIKKRTRAPKQLTAEEVFNGFSGLDLGYQVALIKDFQTVIDKKKVVLQEQIELINANVK